MTIIEGLDPFSSDDGQGFVRLPVSRGFSAIPLRSRAFRQWFFYQCHQRYESLPTPQAFSSFLTFLEGHGNLYHEAFRNVPVSRRVASNGDPSRILLDLSNPQARYVDISPGSWKITAGPDALFQTSRSTRSLPDPILPHPAAPSPLDTLRSCLNFPSHAAWLRSLAWLLAALRPQGPYPFLVLQGPPGSGKTLAARILRSLIDPSTSAFAPAPATLNDLYAAVRDNWVLAFDHVSAFPPPILDALCRLSSGLGAVLHETGRREIEPLLQFHRRPVIFTVTSEFSCPAAIAERALVLDLPRIPPQSRRPEDAIGTTLTTAWPVILGAICSALSAALHRLPGQSPAPGRCADSLAWALAASPALGCTEDEMRRAFDPPPPPHPMVEAIRTLLHERRRWTGSATELRDLLAPALSCATPTVVSHELRTCTLTMADHGIQLQFRRLSHGARVIDLSRESGDALLPKSPESVSQNLDPSPQLQQPEEVTA